MELLFSDRHQELDIVGLRHAIDALGLEAEQWHCDLPSALQESSNVPAPLFQFHAHFYTIMIALYKYGPERLRAVASETVHQSTLDMILAEYNASLLGYVFRLANLVRWNRIAYGHGIPSPFIIHGSAMALFNLLPEMPKSLPGRVHPSEKSLPPDKDSPIRDVVSAFEECFRCLLATGLQQMLPRAIGRMVYHSARKMNVQLPARVTQMLEMAADIGWRSSDVHLVDSKYPNWATERYSDAESRKNGPRMAALLRQWEEVLTID